MTICKACVDSCHVGHEILPLGVSGFYCDCGLGDCKLLPVGSPKRRVHHALTHRSSEAKHLKTHPQHFVAYAR